MTLRKFCSGRSRSKMQVLVLIGVISCVQMTAPAQSPVEEQHISNLKGALTTSGTVTVNEAYTTSNSFVYSESRIKTAENSTAIINLTELGQIRLGADSEMIVRFGKNEVGGSLSFGRVTIQTANSTPIVVVTEAGIVKSDGSMLQSGLTINAGCENLRIKADGTNAKLIMSNDVRIISVDSETLIQQSSGEERCKTLASKPKSPLGRKGIIVLLLAAAAGIITAVALASDDDDHPKATKPNTPPSLPRGPIDKTTQ